MGYASTSAEWAVHNLQFWHNAQEHLVRRRRRWNRKHTTASKASKWQKSRMRAAPVLKKIHPTEKKYLNPPKKNNLQVHCYKSRKSSILPRSSESGRG